MARLAELDTPLKVMITTPVLAADINGSTYQTGCEGLPRLIRVYVAGSASGDAAKLITYQYANATHPQVATNVTETISTVP